MRDRLMELIKNAKTQEQCDFWFGDIDTAIDMPDHEEYLANYLVKHGVIVPPCKVGDTVYDIWDGTACATRVLHFVYFGDYWACRTVSSFPTVGEFGERIFLTKEEAEQALKEREQSDR